MCGIAGTFGFVDEQALALMQKAMHHRGPDERAIWTGDGLCGLSINRLSIMDVAHGQQPLTNQSQNIHVVCNGEIYNHEALREDLEQTTVLRTHSDVEVIAHLYEELGEACVEYLDGMFAFLLYDSRRQTFLAARDPFGIKPLYYVNDAGRWYFASEAKALLAAGVDGSRIRLLEPGCYLSEAGVRRYYDLESRKRRTTADPRLLFDVLDASVRRHLMSDPTIKIGTYLSGGIDSSAITAIAAQYRRDLVAFTVGMAGSPDVENAAVVCEHLGIEHVVVPFTLDQVWDLIPTAVHEIENYNQMLVLEGLMQSVLSHEASQRGVRVMLCGEGADEIFAGYGVYRSMPRADVPRALRNSVAQIGNTECLRVDRATMAHSIEARVPFLDPMVVEYAINLPVTSMLRYDGERVVEKWILRKAVEHLLPAQITWRIKQAFDDASGILNVLDRVSGEITDDDLRAARLRHPEAGLQSKIGLYLYRLFRSHFGDMGGNNVFDLFGHYPTLQSALDHRSPRTWGTGENAADLARLHQGITQAIA
jgi:asparagine synthase (glutamine-hydrolysing)